MPHATRPLDEFANKPYSYFDDYWLEYYRPKALSSFLKVFSYDINSTLRYIPIGQTSEGKYDLSPFKVRTNHGGSSHKKSKSKNNVVINAETPENRLKKITALEGWPSSPRKQQQTLRQTSNPQFPGRDNNAVSGDMHGGLRSSSPVKQHFAVGRDLIPLEQRNMQQVVERSLNPSLSEKETAEYEL
jgi:hypothetical protein